MGIITHGSDLSLAPSITPIARATDGAVRTALARLASAGFSAVQLDATLAGIRPRELDQRARRDLSALHARQNLTINGLDFFIPANHFVESENQDRAMTAALGAIELAADLGKVPVTVSLPVNEIGDDLKSALVEAADGRGVMLAIMIDKEVDALLEWIDAVDLPALGACIDPANLIARDLDVNRTLGLIGKRRMTARLSDQRRGDATRCVIGEGELDVMTYRVSLDLATARTGGIVLDLRGLAAPLDAAGRSLAVWRDAAIAI